MGLFNERRGRLSNPSRSDCPPPDTGALPRPAPPHPPRPHRHRRVLPRQRIEARGAEERRASSHLTLVVVDDVRALAHQDEGLADVRVVVVFDGAAGDPSDSLDNRTALSAAHREEPDRWASLGRTGLLETESFGDSWSAPSVLAGLLGVLFALAFTISEFLAHLERRVSYYAAKR